MTETAAYILSPLALVALALFAATISELAVNRTQRKSVMDDSLIAEAYELCDRCPNTYQRSQLRGIVDSFAKEIEENERVNAQEAARASRRRLHAWVETRKMGS